jgi:hypothetical protein
MQGRQYGSERAEKGKYLHRPWSRYSSLLLRGGWAMKSGCCVMPERGMRDVRATMRLCPPFSLLSVYSDILTTTSMSVRFTHQNQHGGGVSHNQLPGFAHPTISSIPTFASAVISNR